MRLFRAKSEDPPSRLMRKANTGSIVAFKANKNGVSAYWPHVTHKGRIINVLLKTQRHRPSLRAVYEVECECGVILHPRATEFDVVRGGPNEEKD